MEPTAPSTKRLRQQALTQPLPCAQAPTPPSSQDVSEGERKAEEPMQTTSEAIEGDLVQVKWNVYHLHVQYTVKNGSLQ